VVSCPVGGPDPRDIILQKTALGERAWDDIMENSPGHPATRNGEAVGWEFDKEPRRPLFLVRSPPLDAVPTPAMSSILQPKWPEDMLLTEKQKASLLRQMDSAVTKKGIKKAASKVPPGVREALTAPNMAKPVFGRPEHCWVISHDGTPKIRSELAFTLRRDQGGIGVAVAYKIGESPWMVRRITAEETEALQGFRRGWTAVDGVSDRDRRRMMGNSIAVPVLGAIGRRIKAALDAHKASLAPLFATMPATGVPAKAVDKNGAPLPKPDARAARNRRHREATKAKLVEAGVKLRKQNGQPSPEVADLDLTPEELGRLRRLRWRAKNGPESGREKARKQMEAILEQNRPG